MTGPLRLVALRYGELLLRRMKIAGALGMWGIVDDTCVRFERLMAALAPVDHPLVWEGDYA